MIKKLVSLLAVTLIMPYVYFASDQLGSKNTFYESSPSYARDCGDEKKHEMVFTAFAENEEQKYHTLILAESIRTFSGKFRNAPIWIYLPENLFQVEDVTQKKMSSMGVDVKLSQAPAEALDFYFARKVFASAKAEAEAEGKTEILVWMDEDTVVLKEPQDFILGPSVSFGYRPVTHKRIGSLYSESPDEFWSRMYQKLSVPEDSIFPMSTVADKKIIRPYFNAGLLVVRPERGILRKWRQSFTTLYEDPALVEMCHQDENKKLFLHQVALAGAVLRLLKREEMVEFSRLFNYPLLFNELFASEEKFDSIDGVITLRYDVLFRNPPPDWSQKLKGPAEIISWLKERFEKKTKEPFFRPYLSPYLSLRSLAISLFHIYF